jgi:hypothetical protein
MRTTLLILCWALSLLAQTAAGLHWTPPPGWKSEGSTPMRVATYVLPTGPNDRAECAVYFFGQGKGGTVDANMDRWKGQLVDAAGKPSKADIQKKTIHGLNVTTIDTTGNYTGMGGPMNASPTVHANYRLLGAIVEGPGGSIFVKFTGPARLMAANLKNFEQMISSFQTEK